MLKIPNQQIQSHEQNQNSVRTHKDLISDANKCWYGSADALLLGRLIPLKIILHPFLAKMTAGKPALSAKQQQNESPASTSTAKAALWMPVGHHLLCTGTSSSSESRDKSAIQ